MTRQSVRALLDERPWIWSFAAAALVYVGIIFVGQGRGGMMTLQVAAQFASFYVIIGTGQMLVMTGGAGNVDLSIPGVMTLCAYVALSIAGSTDHGIFLGIAAALAVAIVSGLANVILIFVLRIPPMIATLAFGFALTSTAISYSANHSEAPPPALIALAGGKILGVPIIAATFVIMSIVVYQVLLRTVFGRSLLAIGQSEKAAYLAGISVRPTLAITYVISAILAGVCGVLLATFSGGASLDMAGDFLLTSIAVVVLGGTSVAGGQAVVGGVWGAAILLQLVLTLLNVMGVGDGARYLTTGLIILSVLAIAKGR